MNGLPTSVWKLFKWCYQVFHLHKGYSQIGQTLSNFALCVLQFAVPSAISQYLHLVALGAFSSVT